MCTAPCAAAVSDLSSLHGCTTRAPPLQDLGCDRAARTGQRSPSRCRARLDLGAQRRRPVSDRGRLRAGRDRSTARLGVAVRASRVVVAQSPRYLRRAGRSARRRGDVRVPDSRAGRTQDRAVRDRRRRDLLDGEHDVRHHGSSARPLGAAPASRRRTKHAACRPESPLTPPTTFVNAREGAAVRIRRPPPLSPRAASQWVAFDVGVLSRRS